MTTLDYNLAIIIPSWNCEEYISEMLDSILANTYKDYRVFIVDDCSTDNTQEIVKHYQDKDDRIILKERNRLPKGAQTCRNIGFELSEGAKYVIWFDADDIIAPYCLKQRINYMESHPSLDFAIFPAKRFERFPFDENTMVWGYDFLDDTLRCFLNRTLMVVGWTNIYKRDAIVSRSLCWDENILSLQDADWNIQAILSGMKYAYASKDEAKVDYFYRFVPNGIASNIRKSHKHFMSHIYHIEKTLNSLSNEYIIKYERDIRGCLLEFACIMMYDSEAFNALTKISWIQQRFTYLVRLKLLRLMKGHAKFRLFGSSARYHREIQSKWHDYQTKMFNNMKRSYSIETFMNITEENWQFEYRVKCAL